MPLERELAGGSVPPWWGVAQGWMTWPARRTGTTLYGFFREMEEKDAHLYSVLQTRRNALAGADWKVVEASDSARDQAVAAFVREALAGLGNVSQVFMDLLDAFGKGWSVSEVMWRVDGATGRVTPAEVRSRLPEQFALGRDGGLYLLAEGAPAPAQGPAPDGLMPRPGEMMVWAAGARRMPARKFLSFVFQGGAASPYGTPLCARAFWYHWFKKNTVKFWSVYNEKFGAPTAVARYGPSATDAELQRLKQMLESLQHDTGIILPETVQLELIEARRADASDSFRDFAEWCNDEMSKIVLGQTLTTAEGRRSGSLALARVHDRVRGDYLAADARALGECATAQLVRWLVDFNFGPGVPAPRFVFDVAGVEEFLDELKLDEQLVRLGVALPAGYFYGKYRRPVPAPGDRDIRYDDQNLYQYHLQFGVLTINEVRASLGLGPVPWGDAPPRSFDEAQGAARAGSRADRPEPQTEEAAEDDGAEQRRERRRR